MSIQFFNTVQQVARLRHPLQITLSHDRLETIWCMMVKAV